uniref:cyclin-dependent kinase F-4-like n=1 Tax=Erigeron canadensis TaxID=72917 RepID=UPI001CB9D68F|nr:cyclin-dependent kinase F-4-like [Erigeron canadensis]
MEKYQIIEEVGRGSYGVVWKSLNNETDETVAIKKIKTMYLSTEESMNLTDVNSLIKMMNHHPNIIKLKEIIRENHQAFLVYEYMECSLYKVMVERKKPFSETEVKELCYPVFKGLAYMHHNGNFHHDLKPDSILVDKKNDAIKIDLGHAREMNGNSPCTDYVTGCWYRAPEAILDSSVYNYAVDMWAMGAIMVELFTLKPLFQGSCEKKVYRKICSLFGPPPNDQDLASEIDVIIPDQLPGVSISELLPCASPDAVDLIASLLSWHPKNRPTAMEALQHPFFNRCYYAPPLLPHQLAKECGWIC